jgi:hypothetical protein
MPLGNLQHVALVTAVCNTMFGFMQLGQVMQAGFTHAHAAWTLGNFFAGSGSNPFLSDILVHLPSVDATVAAAVNVGFWLPFMLLICAIVWPAFTFRVSVWLGAGRRPALARLMAAHLQTGEFGNRAFDPQAPMGSAQSNTQGTPLIAAKQLRVLATARTQGSQGQHMFAAASCRAAMSQEDTGYTQTHFRSASIRRLRRTGNTPRPFQCNGQAKAAGPAAVSIATSTMAQLAAERKASMERAGLARQRSMARSNAGRQSASTLSSAVRGVHSTASPPMLHPSLGGGRPASRHRGKAKKRHSTLA